MPIALAVLRLHETGMAVQAIADVHALSRQRIYVLLRKARKGLEDEQAAK